MRRIGIGVLGIGTVGTGVVRLLTADSKRIAARLGAEAVVSKIACSDLAKERPVDIDRALLTDDVQSIIEDPAIDIIVELVGGVNEARDYLYRALKSGKHVVTANKAVLAQDGEQLTQLATDNNLDLYYEASVCAGIPIIRAIREALASDRIQSLCGIINGTTNYILTRMYGESREIADVIQDAVREGFAEADPSIDVDGYDAAQKLAILSALAFGLRVTPNDVFTEGITELDRFDLAIAAELGFSAKLLSIAVRRERGVEVRVHPALIPNSSLLSQVSGVYNAVLLDSQASGQQLLYGRGAGMMPTASAVVSDVIEICRNILQGRHGRVAGFGDRSGNEGSASIIPMEESRSRYFLHVEVVDQPGVLGTIASILGDHQVSIAQMRQPATDAGKAVPLIMLTHEAREGNLRAALLRIDQLDITFGKSRLIRVISPEVSQ